VGDRRLEDLGPGVPEDLAELARRPNTKPVMAVAITNSGLTERMV